MNDQLKCEVAVVGSGPGGAVTAATCAAAGRHVLMLEEGENLRLGSAPHFSREEILQKYRNAGINIAFGNPKIAYVEGRCVGGGSEINRGLYHRTPDEVLDGWRSAFSVHELTPERMKEHFDFCEQVAKVAYLPPGEAPAISRRLHMGAERLGWQCIEVPRLCTYTTAQGAAIVGSKQSMSETFIPRALDAGATILANTRAERLRRHGRRWSLIVRRSEPHAAPRTLEVVADSVFIACGAVQTPALLRRSGITRNVGNSLRFHPMLKVVAVFPDEVNTPGELEPVHQIKHFDPRFSMGCSMSKRPALAMAMAMHGAHLGEVRESWRRMAIYYAQSTGGQGTVRSLPGFRDPLVRVSQSAHDLEELAEGVRKLCECLFAAGALTVYPSIPGYPILHGEEDLRALPDTLAPKMANTTALHLFSSCPMGEDVSRCAADSFGKVHGMDGLFLADASLLCGPTVVNPQGSVMVVAHRNAQHFLQGPLRRT